MGGGSAIRAASKFAGLGVYGGLRGASPAVAPAEQAVRKSSVPVSAILSTSSPASADVARVQRPAWELDGWEFAGGEDDLVMAAGEPMPRVVFAGIPSFDEAKEATIELKEAVDMLYLSPPKSAESKELVTSDKLSGLSLISKPDDDINSNALVGAAPNHALKAFKLLSTNSEVQRVVASITSDPKVWNAVIENPVLQEFIDSQQKIAVFKEPFTEKSENSSDSSKANPWASWFKGLFNNIKENVVNIKENVVNIKDNVVKLVSSFSSKMETIFESDGKEAVEGNHTLLTGASIMGLVTMVVMVVVFKRI